jgi:hypothetical protein
VVLMLLRLAATDSPPSSTCPAAIKSIEEAWGGWGGYLQFTRDAEGSELQEVNACSGTWSNAIDEAISVPDIVQVKMRTVSSTRAKKAR